MTAFLRTYQTLIVGVLGFSGVILTLAINAWLARCADRRKIAHEANVLRTAIIEEMKIQRSALVNSEETLKQQVDLKKTSPTVLIPLQRFTEIFDKSIDKLGLLTSDEVAAILDAYLTLRQLTPKMRILEQRVPPHDRGVEYGQAPVADYAQVTRQDIIGFHAVYIPPFDKAIERLQSNLSKS
jgi:hypothetical protein